MAYSWIKNGNKVYIDTLADTPEKFVGRDICVEGWVTECFEEDEVFIVSKWVPSVSSELIVVVGGWALEKLPEVGDAVSVRGEWGTTETGVFYLEADEVDCLDKSEELDLIDRLRQREGLSL